MSAGAVAFSFYSSYTTAHARNNERSSGYDPAIAIPALTGSLLSAVATAAVICSWCLAGGSEGRRKRKEFRYVLVLNLAVAEFINSLNNSISGISVVGSGGGLLEKNLSCEVNGWVGQMSVQAVDFSVLAISLVTLLTIQLRSCIIYASMRVKMGVCAAVWVVPLVTSTLALHLDLYAPVSGNWCWIGAQHTRLRYALTHGWRFAILLITFCIYIFVFAYMHRRLRTRNVDQYVDSSMRSGNEGGASDYEVDEEEMTPAPAKRAHGHHRAASSFSFTARAATSTTTMTTTTTTQNRHLPPQPPPYTPFSSAPTPTLRSPTSSQTSLHSPYQPTTLHQNPDRLPPPQKSAPPSPSPPYSPLPVRIRPSNTHVDRDVWQMVLLNLYPVTYLLLWLPGIANRLVEATGGESHALRIAQASTQYIGLVNAGVWAYREFGGVLRGRWWG